MSLSDPPSNDAKGSVSPTNSSIEKSSSKMFEKTSGNKQSGINQGQNEGSTDGKSISLTIGNRDDSKDSLISKLLS